ncbi:hypothetical protein LTR27_011982 [Elasticomyces elasticus]|nr:hypothetical protein LTR27_011982 [Elasticomyces elasticus]
MLPRTLQNDCPTRTILNLKVVFLVPGQSHAELKLGLLGERKAETPELGSDDEKDDDGGFDSFRMRLLNTTTLELHEFANPPVYAILSHRWSDEEVTYEDYSLVQRARRKTASEELLDEVSKIRSRSGFTKIEACCRYAREDQQAYV